MWVSVGAESGPGAPGGRGKHSATLLGGYVYVLGDFNMSGITWLLNQNDEILNYAKPSGYENRELLCKFVDFLMLNDLKQFNFVINKQHKILDLVLCNEDLLQVSECLHPSNMEKYLKSATTTTSNSSSSSKRPLEDPLSPGRWSKPKKFVSNSKETVKDASLPVNNSFKSLPIDVGEKSSAHYQNSVKRKATNNTLRQLIILITIELNGVWTHQKIREVIFKYTKDFHMQCRGRKLVKVQCYKSETHQKVKEGLLSENVYFHTHARKDEKHPKAIIKGLPKFAHDNIPDELDALGFNGAKVVALKTHFPTECPPILVQLPIWTNMSKFKQIKYLKRLTLDIPGYICYRADKRSDNTGQGVAILVRADLPHNLVCPPQTRHLEVVGITLISQNSSVVIYSVYQSLNLPLIKSDLDLLMSSGSKVVVMGDLNSKHPLWSPGVGNTRGKTLYEHMVANDYTIHAPRDCTLVHYTADFKPSTPDLLLAKIFYPLENITTVAALSSNHFPVLAKFTTKLQRFQIRKLNFAKADWNKYRNYLNSNTYLSSQTFESPLEIDETISKFQKSLLQARDLSVPFSSLTPWSSLSLPRRIKRLIKHKNRLRRYSLLERNLLVKRILINPITRYNDYEWDLKLKRVDNPSSDVWRLVKGLRSNSTNPIPALHLENGLVTNTIQEQCNLLGRTFFNNMLLTSEWPSNHDELIDCSLTRLEKETQIESIFLPTRGDCNVTVDVAATGRWERLEARGEAPPSLQEHSGTAHEGRLYLQVWRKLSGAACPTYKDVRRLTTTGQDPRGAGAGPRGRRGHSAHALRDCLLIYGGYRDLRGSTNELWAFHYETEWWQQVRTSTPGPARHRHAAVLHDTRLYVHGGQCDLQDCADLWHYDTISRVWTSVRTPAKLSPSARSGHAGLRAGAHLYIFGGEANGHPTNELWRFHFATETWERIVQSVNWPTARVDCCALLVGTSGSRAAPTEPRGHETRPEPPAGFLREISKLSSFRIRRAARCSYSVLGDKDSTESLIRLPSTMSKSRSAYIIDERQPADGDDSPQPCPRQDMSREPISVPDFADMVLPTPVLSPVEATKLVYFDSEEEEDMKRFSNPHYLGPDVRRLGSAMTPDSGVGAGDIELQELGERKASQGRLYLMVVGGREPAHPALLRRPLSMWTYRLL
ncbi:unnamed protein product [Leptidea sinapis]|uniref:Endonuclease/exonuclease/phosphatase domain-containing protein n=1 Tax=Leptidea sinapis TaxID=189913 RepID=A0A5E4R4I0_9NEOP|nr:unnamed protein product [Leptidea sinapis]